MSIFDKFVQKWKEFFVTKGVFAIIFPKFITYESFFLKLVIRRIMIRVMIRINRANDSRELRISKLMIRPSSTEAAEAALLLVPNTRVAAEAAEEAVGLEG